MNTRGKNQRNYFNWVIAISSAMAAQGTCGVEQRLAVFHLRPYLVIPATMPSGNLVP
jgi:hypothetical protein